MCKCIASIDLKDYGIMCRKAIWKVFEECMVQEYLILGAKSLYIGSRLRER